MGLKVAMASEAPFLTVVTLAIFYDKSLSTVTNSLLYEKPKAYFSCIYIFRAAYVYRSSSIRDGSERYVLSFVSFVSGLRLVYQYLDEGLFLSSQAEKGPS
ncbi:hypothetical protein CUU66_13650 [Peribacillus deserti]|uniref:Uncharacterized protein n=1 Tax=Peribacillus deserti TaxID=673318 RepID=A0A2N5M4U0_9BACI|nr:hypothetical protein CUU66_13650 [Peribacillus deserti]